MKKSQRTGVSTFAIRTSQRTDQKLQKSFHLSCPLNRLSGRFWDCLRSKKQNKFVLRG